MNVFDWLLGACGSRHKYFNIFGILTIFGLVEGKMRLFSNFSGVYLLFSLWYSPANGQIGGTQHYGNRVMGKWYQAEDMFVSNKKKCMVYSYNVLQETIEGNDN